VRDIGLLRNMRNKLGCAKVHAFKDGMYNFSVRNKRELTNIIIPFLDKYPLNVQKKIGFFTAQENSVNLEKKHGKRSLSLEDRKFLDLCRGASTFS